MPAFSHESFGLIFLITAISFGNGAVLGLFFACCPGARRATSFRVFALLYVAISLLVFCELAPEEFAQTPLGYWCFMATASGYLPVVVYILAAWIASIVEFTVMRSLPDHDTSRFARWRIRLLNSSRIGQKRLLEVKLRELRRKPTDPRLRRELADLYTRLGEFDHALYHTYSLVELLPRGHGHGFALYRLCQILVDQLGRLDAAQPYLRRIIRIYPRSFFASYARRLVNRYQAFADREG